MKRKALGYGFIASRVRSDRPAVDWVSADHYGLNQELIDKLEAKAPGILWALGVWPDLEVAKRCNVRLSEVTRARRVIGAPAMTIERNAEVERRVGPFCQVLLEDGYEYEAFRLRRWAAGLFHLGKDRTRKFGRPGEAWWTNADCRTKNLQEMSPIGAKNCFTCRFWRGARNDRVRLAPYCMAPKGIRRLIGRRWLHQHNGDMNRTPHASAVNCPGWTEPIPGRGRVLTQHIHTDKAGWWEAGRSPLHIAPWPLHPIRGWKTVHTDEWLELMDAMRHNLESRKTKL